MKIPKWRGTKFSFRYQPKIERSFIKLERLFCIAVHFDPCPSIWTQNCAHNQVWCISQLYSRIFSHDRSLWPESTLRSLISWLLMESYLIIFATVWCSKDRLLFIIIVLGQTRVPFSMKKSYSLLGRIIDRIDILFLLILKILSFGISTIYLNFINSKELCLKPTIALTAGIF